MYANTYNKIPATATATGTGTATTTTTTTTKMSSDNAFIDAIGTTTTLFNHESEYKIQIDLV